MPGTPLQRLEKISNLLCLVAWVEPRGWLRISLWSEVKFFVTQGLQKLVDGILIICLRVDEMVGWPFLVGTSGALRGHLGWPTDQGRALYSRRRCCANTTMARYARRLEVVVTPGTALIAVTAIPCLAPERSEPCGQGVFPRHRLRSRSREDCGALRTSLS